MVDEGLPERKESRGVASSWSNAPEAEKTAQHSREPIGSDPIGRLHFGTPRGQTAAARRDMFA